jgi:Protein of unknown function (DUF3073)
MGRGRQKAKHTKVARELKYFSPNTDLTALEKEIGHIAPANTGFAGDAEPEYEDKWADLYGEDDEDGEDSEAESDSK